MADDLDENGTITDEVRAELEADAGGNSLTIRITPKGEGVPLGTLLKALDDLLGILRELDQSTSINSKISVEWEIVSASFNSPLTLRIVGRKRLGGPEPGRIVDAYLVGLSDLEAGRESQIFSERAMTNAQDIARMVLRDGIAAVEFSRPGLPSVTPTRRLVENVESIIKKRYYHEDAWIEGRLETINIHNKLIFSIFDILTHRETRCFFGEHMLGLAVAALGKRVAVDGKVKYNRAGWPVTMEARDMKQLRDAGDLPQFIEGEQIDITGGMESTEYVRRLRDAE